jgi:phospholipase/lecithinase/hemolysin
MLTLAAAGAQQFLVWRVPDVGATPAIRALGPQAQGVASALTQAFNNALEAQVLGPLGAGGLRIVRLDVYGKLNQIIANPADFGLTNVTSACITPNVAPFQCHTPDDFLFWDGIHPTAAGHGIIAQQAASALSSH